MKLSKIMWHNGAIKIEVYQKNQERKRWNTGIRIARKFLNKDKFVIENSVTDWKAHNIKIAEEKEKVDKAVRNTFKKFGFVNVLHVFQDLEDQYSQEQEAHTKQLQNNRIPNGFTKWKMSKAINTLDASFNSLNRDFSRLPKSFEESSEDRQKRADLLRRQKFLELVNEYVQKEVSLTSADTVSKCFAKYLNEGTSISVNNLKRHYLILRYIISNPLLMDEMNDVWIRGLIEWLRFGMKGQIINSNTTSWYFSRFQCFWKWAIENNFISRRISWKKFKIPTFKAGFVWLTTERIEQLSNVQFEDERLENTRRAFLVLCLTGMRQSDFHSLKPSEVITEDGSKWIHKNNKKTKSEFKAELTSEIETLVLDPDVLKKMKLSINRTISDQKLNESIREIGEKLEWNEDVRLRVDWDKWDTKPFYKWMCCHCARHTAVCSWLVNGYTVPEIKKLTGLKGSNMIDYYGDILNLRIKKRIGKFIAIKSQEHAKARNN